MKNIISSLLLIAMSLNTYASNFVIPIRDGLKFASSNTTPEINPDTSIKCGVGEGVTRAELDTMIANGDDVTQVCTSNITDFSNLFMMNDLFNQDISKWDVSNGTNFSGMFGYASAFNQDIGAWDVSNGTNFRYMFQNADIFNQPLNNWDVSKGKGFAGMFYNAKAFNQDITSWNVELADDWNDFRNHSALAYGNTPLKFRDVIDCSIGEGVTRVELQAMIDKGEDVTQVCTSNITDFNNLFAVKIYFNQDISNWDVSNGTNFSQMFWGAKAFNQDIGDWDVSNGTDFNGMFSNADSFNQNIGYWSVHQGTDFSYMFQNALSFNQNISWWNTSSAMFWDNFRTASPLTDENTPPKFK